MSTEVVRSAVYPAAVMTWLLFQLQKIEGEWRVFGQPFPSEDAARTHGDCWVAEDPVRRRFSVKLAS